MFASRNGCRINPLSRGEAGSIAIRRHALTNSWVAEPKCESYKARLRRLTATRLSLERAVCRLVFGISVLVAGVTSVWGQVPGYRLRPFPAGRPRRSTVYLAARAHQLRQRARFLRHFTRRECPHHRPYRDLRLDRPRRMRRRREHWWPGCRPVSGRVDSGIEVTKADLRFLACLHSMSSSPPASPYQPSREALMRRWRC